MSTMQIRGKKYPKPNPNKFKRHQVKAIKPIMAKIQDNDMEALWEVIELLFPDIPAHELDDLDLAECKSIVERAEIASFKNESGDSISLGES